MPKYRLHYFNLTGRAELCRLLFAAAGQEYEDVRYGDDCPQAWNPETKAKMPLGQMPVLEIDGVTYCQGAAISRYLARKFGLMGDDDEEALYADMICETMTSELGPKMGALVHETDEEKKKEKREKICQEFPEIFAKIERWIKGDYFLGSKMSIADISLVSSKMMKVFVPELTFPEKLKGIAERVEDQAGIKRWLETRPKTKF